MTTKIVWLIIVLAAILRFYNLSSIPPSVSLDEASIGYNAYSILQTGKDEFGNFFPVLLRAYDDWRPGLYVYLVIPLLPLFGLSTLAVRFPAVLLSILTVCITYLFVKELFRKDTLTIRGVKLSTETVALVAALLLAISPWHIYLSRLGHEVNLGLTTVVLGIFFFMKAINDKEKMRYALLSSCFFVISLYGYQSQKIIVPVLLLGFSVIFYKEISSHWKEFFLAGLMGVVLLIPLILASSDPQALVRFRATSAFSGLEARYQKSAEKIVVAKKNNDIVAEVFNNRRFVAPMVFIENYFSHFNPNWLFRNSGKEQHKIPGLGLMFPWELLFIAIGIVVYFSSKLDRKYKLLLLMWFFSAPLAAAITTGAPHAMRSYTFLPVWQIFSAIGLIFTFYYSKRRVPAQILLVMFIITTVVSTAYLAYNYFVVFSKEQSSSFQYALAKVIPYVQGQAEYSTVVFSNKENLYQSYMFYLFFTQFDPQKYQALGGTKSGGYAEPHKIGRYEFREVSEMLPKKDTLYVVNMSDFPNIQSKSTFANLDGEPVIKVIENEEP